MKSLQTLEELIGAINKIPRLGNKLFIANLYMKGVFFDFNFDADGMIPDSVYKTSAKIEEILKTSFANRVKQGLRIKKYPPYKIEGIETARDSTNMHYLSDRLNLSDKKLEYYGFIYAPNLIAQVQLWARQEMPEEDKSSPEGLKQLQRLFRFEMSLPLFNYIDRGCTKKIVTEIWPLIHHFETQPYHSLSGDLLSDYDQIPHRIIKNPRRAIEIFEKGIPKIAEGLDVEAALYYLDLKLPEKSVVDRSWRLPPEMYGGD